MKKSESNLILERNRKYIAGGVVSLNRLIEPMRVFERAQGAYIWDAEGRRYIDYHSAFSPFLLGHCDPDVDSAVVEAIGKNQSLFGAGTTRWEGELSELIVNCVPSAEQVQITNTGTEATYHAVRIARAATGRDGIVIIQGGYNGWHNDVAFNLMDSTERLAQSNPGEERPLFPISAGIPHSVHQHVHVVEFNDLSAVRQVFEKGTIAGIILEPVLQNIGIVKPLTGYLEGLRRLCDEYSVLLIFDEVKTGFRQGLSGYQGMCGVKPDLSTFGKAIANGYPLGVIGGKQEFMRYLYHPDSSKRVLMAGTYNAHPVPVAAAIATLRKLKMYEGKIYTHLKRLGKRIESGLHGVFAEFGRDYSIVRQGSAFIVYFMDHEPVSWLDIANNHDMDFDRAYRAELIKEGIFYFPMPNKHGSISYAHCTSDIDEMIETTAIVLHRLESRLS